MESIVSSQLPEFKAQAFQNGSFRTVTDEDVKGKWAIFFFYPADFTPVCPTELVDVAEKYNQLQAMGVGAYFVNTDSHFVHRAWHDVSESIRKTKYPVLTDPTGALSRSSGIMIKGEGMACRGTFLVNPEGKIKLVGVQDDSVGRNADELPREVEAAQFVVIRDDEVCPAKWKKGATALKPSIDLVGKIQPHPYTVNVTMQGLSPSLPCRSKGKEVVSFYISTLKTRITMLGTSILDQARSIFQPLEARYTFHITYNPKHEQVRELIDFLNRIASCSDKLSYRLVETETPGPELTLLKEERETRIKFRAIPGEHEFSSLLLAVLNVDGKGKNLPNESIDRRIRALKGAIRLQTYVSLTCVNRPGIVQALSAMALLSPHITHEMVDGAPFQEEVDALKIQAVPSIYVNGRQFHVGHGSLGELFQKLEDTLGSLSQEDAAPVPRKFDLFVLGGEPTGTSAAIYSACKGLHVAIITERIDGQVKETIGIENLISISRVTGSQLVGAFRNHIGHYSAKVLKNRRIEKAELQGKERKIFSGGGETSTAPAVIIATGTSQRKLNAEGETGYIGHGVVFRLYYGGPSYQGKHVAAIGGGNSGIEATIDLAGIYKKVTVFESTDTLRADRILQKKAQSPPSMEILASSQTIRVEDDDEKVTGIHIKNHIINEERDYLLGGILTQIDLTVNGMLFRDVLEITTPGEIKMDTLCRTTIPGVYAAGDVSNVSYKQIVITTGGDAKVALFAFDDRTRGII